MVRNNQIFFFLPFSSLQSYRTAINGEVDERAPTPSLSQSSFASGVLIPPSSTDFSYIFKRGEEKLSVTAVIGDFSGVLRSILQLKRLLNLIGFDLGDLLRSFPANLCLPPWPKPLGMFGAFSFFGRFIKPMPLPP